MKKDNFDDPFNSSKLFDEEKEDSLNGVEFETCERYTTKVKLNETLVLSDEHCDVRIIEPVGFLPELVLVEIETNDEEDDILFWPPRQHVVDEVYHLIIRAYQKVLSQVHIRLCRGRYTIDEYLKTFKCFNRTKVVTTKEEKHEIKKKKAHDPEA